VNVPMKLAPAVSEYSFTETASFTWAKVLSAKTELKVVDEVWESNRNNLAQNAAWGRKEESGENLAELIAQEAPYRIASVYAFRGETDRAFEWLERAYTERDAGLTEMKTDPLLTNLKRDPRYAALLKKMGLPL
jgi:hypothetical protein